MSNLLQQRRAGVLLHPTSLPSGKLDGDVERWLDFLSESCLTVWQVLPLVIPDHTGSPYQSCSAFAANPGLLADADAALSEDREHLQVFTEAQKDWLPDFATFMLLQQQYPDSAWEAWPEHYRDRDPQAIAELLRDHEDAYWAHIQRQYHLDQRWQQIRRYAAERNILLFGDIPIFVALNSVDVWANRGEFLLDEHGQPQLVAGVPPDYFSETGQRWGNPHYNWEKMQDNGFSWWKARLKRKFEWFDIVRLDHFRGLESSWMIEADCDTAIDGYWQKVPGEALLNTLRRSFPDLPIVAEDLGIITPEVTALRKAFELPGMAVMQFAFDGSDDNPHKPENVTADHVVYSGTHDNNTTRGWFNNLDAETRQFVFKVLEGEEDDDIVNLMVCRLMESNASLAMLPLQDVLGLGQEARMNTPGLVEGNWRWQFEWHELPVKEEVQALRDLIETTGRCS